MIPEDTPSDDMIFSGKQENHTEDSVIQDTPIPSPHTESTTPDGNDTIPDWLKNMSQTHESPGILPLDETKWKDSTSQSPTDDGIPDWLVDSVKWTSANTSTEWSSPEQWVPESNNQKRKNKKKQIGNESLQAEKTSSIQVSDDAISNDTTNSIDSLSTNLVPDAPITPETKKWENQLSTADENLPSWLK
jgi:hypothetical protein